MVCNYGCSGLSLEQTEILAIRQVQEHILIVGHEPLRVWTHPLMIGMNM